MNTKIIVEGVVAVLIVLAVVVPIVGGMGESIHSVSYNAGERYTVAMDGSELNDIEIIMDPANNLYSVDGVVQDITIYSSTYVISDKFSLRYNGEQIYGLVQSSNPIVQTSSAVKIVSSAGVATIYVGDTEIPQGDIEFLFYPSDQGDYGAFAAGILNVDISEPLYAFHGPQYMTGDYNLPYIVTKVTDGSQQMIVGKYNAQGTITQLPASTLNYTYNEVDKYHGTYEISNISFSISGTDYNKDVLILAPLSYSYISGNDTITSTLVGLVPVILVVGIILLIVYASVMRREEY